jgi:prepilin-type N-terminal cleavage/methylation domain-containing protein
MIFVRNEMKRFQAGFTLLELMMVIAIIGVMATMAIPALQNYMVRARVMEGFEMAMPARMAVEETYLSQHRFPRLQQETNFSPPAPTTNVASIEIAANNGQVIINYTEKAGNGSLIFSPMVSEDGQITWDCKAGSLAMQYRPQVCRED